MSRILIVEDETIISEPFALVLEAHGYQVDIAANGIEALDYCQKQQYGLILLDIMMPLCDGVQFLARAKLKAASPDTRVVVMSNLARGPQIDEALLLGAESSILKAHMTPHSLIELVQKELSHDTKKSV